MYINKAMSTGKAMTYYQCLNTMYVYINFINEYTLMMSKRMVAVRCT